MDENYDFGYEENDERRWVEGGFYFVNEHGDEEFVASNEWKEHVKS